MGLGEVVGGVGAAVAVGALWVSLLARRDSKASARAAVTSAESSERSAVAAEQSFELSRLEARRRVERTDVKWELEKSKDHPGVLVYRNVGTTTAYAVTAALTINNQRVDVIYGDIPANGIIEYDAEEIYALAAQKAVAATAAWRAGGPRFGDFPPKRHIVVATARISCQSELGTPMIQML
jgi:hypothetical protein